MKYYAVKNGRHKGVYTTWKECEAEIKGFKGAVYKSFPTKEEAEAFLEDHQEIRECQLIAYVDGSYHIKEKVYGYGVVLIEGGRVIKKIYGKGEHEDYVSMRNVAGEIFGSEVAVEYAIANGYDSIAIYYDYMGIEKWANGEWKANKPGTKRYVEKMKDYRKKIYIHFIKVLAHSGDTFNDEADRLAKKAARCCVAFEGMERFFPADRIMLTGNPVRKQMLETTLTRNQAINSLGLDPEKKTVLIVGGSLGARTLNESVLAHLDDIRSSGVQFIWQTGKYYHASILDELKVKGQPEGLKVMDFITDMGAAYRAADLVISRAGASSVSEFCLIGKPVIMVPSPNVTEDHQTKNAMALVNKQAALIVKDAEAKEQLIGLAISTVKDDAKLRSLSENVLKLALPDSADIIAKEVIKIVQNQ